MGGGGAFSHPNPNLNPPRPRPRFWYFHRLWTLDFGLWTPYRPQSGSIKPDQTESDQEDDAVDHLAAGTNPTESKLIQANPTKKNPRLTGWPAERGSFKAIQSYSKSKNSFRDGQRDSTFAYSTFMRAPTWTRRPPLFFAVRVFDCSTSGCCGRWYRT